MSLHDPASICVPNLCFSLCMSVGFILFEVPNHFAQHPLLSLAEDGIEGESFSHFGELFSFVGFLPCIRVIQLLFDFLLLI